MKKETIFMDVKLMSLWMTWIFQLHNCNHLETKVIPHFQRRIKNSNASDHISSTSFTDAATLLKENIGAVSLEISRCIAFEVLIQQK
ncbi:hypothetical protein Goshw_011212 [Gossypium schwendimanii]|uniref:Uncharacterized protein n=1 Tax=Gossypium schwendimanii TaxID=34291 RepID=A0A7J9M3E2_GOSSC|nr:hypothetical protein [Gossypium schwendimanii]MBA0865337.1 hypothetical protein [Gossypium schwendimanii]